MKLATARRAIVSICVCHARYTYSHRFLFFSCPPFIHSRVSMILRLSLFFYFNKYCDDPSTHPTPLFLNFQCDVERCKNVGDPSPPLLMKGGLTPLKDGLFV